MKERKRNFEEREDSGGENEGYKEEGECIRTMGMKVEKRRWR